MRKVLVAFTVLLSLFLVGCDRPADTVSHNISKAADNFEI